MSLPATLGRRNESDDGFNFLFLVCKDFCARKWAVSELIAKIVLVFTKKNPSKTRILRKM